MSIIIDPEFKSMIRPLTEDEFRQLECSVLDDGLIDPLVIWAEERILLDGHHRYRVCQKYGLEVKITALHFDSRADARQWMINHQLGRRNVTPEQAAYLRGKDYLTGEKHQGARVDLHPPDPSGQPDMKLSLDLADRLATQHEVSPRTITRDAKFAESLGELTTLLGDGFKADVLGGKSGLTKQDIVALKEMPPQDVAAKAGDYVALHDAAVAWRKAREEKAPARGLGTPGLQAVIGEIARACGNCPNDRKGCRRLLRNVVKTAQQALRMKEGPVDVAA